MYSGDVMGYELMRDYGLNRDYGLIMDNGLIREYGLIGGLELDPLPPPPLLNLFNLLSE